MEYDNDNHPSRNAAFRVTYFTSSKNAPPEDLECYGCGYPLRWYGDDQEHWQERSTDRVYLSNATGAYLCDRCAGEIANFYNKVHGGEWLTWPNPPRPASRASKWKIRPGLRREIYERDHYRCRYCGEHQDLGIDHVIPVTDPDSSNDPSNLVTCCRSCNSRKGSRTPEAAGMALRPEPGPS